MPPRRSNHSRPRHRAARTGVSSATIRRRRVVAAVSAVLVVLGVVLGFALSGSSAPRGANTGPLVARCPLTDEPAPGGHVPDRPALAVKIGNEPDGARPQSGLNEADIVYDTPAEGFIMRYMAVYQCHPASSVGPTRSVRWVDWHLVQQFATRGKAMLAFAGGIPPDVSTVDGLSFVQPADLLTTAAAAGERIATRVPPDNLYTSTAKLWALAGSDTAPPEPVFSYSDRRPRDSQVTKKVAINFSTGTDATWTWDPSSHLWLHAYASGPDIDQLTGKQVSTSNVVIEIVKYTYGPYPENPGGTGDVESVTTGSGNGWVLRNGVSIPVTWSRPTTRSTTTFADEGGNPVQLSPGRTWVEIVLDTVAAQPGAITFTH